MTLTDALNRATGRPRSPASQLAEETQRVGNLLAKAHDAGEHDDPGAKAALIRALEREHDELVSAWHREAAAEGLGSGLTLAKGERMTDRYPLQPGMATIGQLVRGRVLDKWEGVSSDVRAQLLTSGVDGAIPGEMTGGIIDAARQESVVFRAGAQTMPIEGSGAKVTRLRTEPAPQWAPEASDRALDAGAFTFDTAAMTPCSVWTLASFSIEALEDAIDLDATITRSFAAQLGLAMDTAALVGAGDSSQPLGLTVMDAATDRIGETLAAGAVDSYAPFILAVGARRAAHKPPTSVMLPPALWTQIALLTNTLGDPLTPPRAYAELAEYVTDLLPSNGGVGTDESTAVVGDFTAMTVGVRTGFTLEVSRVSDGFRKGMVDIRAYCRFGLYLTEPKAFHVIRGLTIPDAGS